MKNSKKNRKRTVNTKKILAVFFVIIIAFLAIYIKKNSKNESFKITPEIARSREYDVVQTGDERTDSEYVLFDAFFLKDLDGDENADAIRGTCNEVGKEDTLYMDLKVINKGHFKDGVITINSKNFKLGTTLVKDQIIAQNYISDNTKKIKLKDIPNGNQKLITGIVRALIGNDTNNYTKINSVTLTGTHVDDNGTETPINKTINFTVDWYGTVTAKIQSKNIKKNADNMDQLLNDQQIKLDFDIKTEETDNELILKSSTLEGTIPELNGYQPISVKIEGDNIVSEYNAETGHFIAKREAVLDENGVVTSLANTSENSSKMNTYKFKLVYPRAAYDNMEGDVLELLIPVKTYYEGFNNTNNQFQNPYVSNTDETTVAVRWTKTEGFVYRFDIEVGKYSVNPYFRYLIKKEKPLKIYNKISEEEKQDYYSVRWQLIRGNQGNDENVIMKETKNNATQVSDIFVKTDHSTESMEQLTSNAGIYFVGADSMFGTNGWIKIYDDSTNTLLVTFTRDNWSRYNENNPYFYENTVKHIRIETSPAKRSTNFSVFNIKELDDSYITENYSREQFDKLNLIKSTLNGYYGTNLSTVTNYAYYEAPTSVAYIDISKNNLSTQETCENQIITIIANDKGLNTQKWKNGTFLVKIPQEIINMEINSLTIDNNDVTILGYDLYKENDSYFIKILTDNTKESSLRLNIDCNMTPDPRTTTVSRSIELYAINEIGMNYCYKTADEYDLDVDSNTNEMINHAATGISLISPNELLTNQIATKYDAQNSVTVSPNVAIVKKQQRTAEIQINITNNYSQEVTDVVLQGVIPFSGNKYVVGDRDLGSTFSTYMSNTGIQLPNELKNYATVYYSTEEKPTNDLTNNANKWKKAEKITNWNDIKTFLIDLGEYKMQKGESKQFVYEVNIPENINYNGVSYSEHAIYFSLLTDAGKYSTFTAANKLGLKIAKLYDIELQKYQKNTTKKLKGITFSVTEEGANNSSINVTNNNGIINFSGLSAEKSYILKEIKSTDDYVLNSEEIKFYTYTDENDNLYLVYKNDDGTYSNLADKYDWLKTAELTKNGDVYKAKLTLENEARARLKIIKTDSQTGEKQKNVKFTIDGKDITNVLFTNNDGELNLKGLYIDEEYTITENSNKGYYLLDPIKLKITKSDETYSTQIIEGNVKDIEVKMVDSIPEINLTLENDKVPTYKLQITKIEENNENKTLAGTEFIITGEDTNLQKRLTTNEEGTVSINNLYQHVDGKEVTGKYTLKETKAPNGYVDNTEQINFVVNKNGDNLEINIENRDNLTSIAKTEVDGNTVKITIQDKPLFKIVKENKQTGEKLANAKFTIYEIDDEGNELDFAKDINGDYVGTLNSNNKYEVVTNENGEITLPLKNGTYKAAETEPPTGYEKMKYDEIFKISENENTLAEIEKETTETQEINYIEDLLDLSKNVADGNNYSYTKFVLKKNLDFKDEASYRNAEDTTTYGDYNGDGTTETIIQELSKGKGFIPIGNNSKPFKGAFDGQNKEISNLYINSTSQYTGLFGYINDGEVKNTRVAGKIKSTQNYTGGIVGYYYRSYNVNNCISNVDIEGSSYIGGIIGDLAGTSIIDNCINNGNITGQSYIGGIVGDGVKNITNCTNTGKITGVARIGGIFGNITGGMNQFSGEWELTNCYNEGEITGAEGVGGLSGFASGTLKISSSCNYGDIYIIPNSNRNNNASKIGGLTGNAYNNIILYDCYNNGNISLKDNSLEFGTVNDIGGLVGDIHNQFNISYCGNNGNIVVPNATYIGGIKGNRNYNPTNYENTTFGNSLVNSYNTGDIYGKNYIGGISIGNTYLEDVLNSGDIVFSDPSYIGGLSTLDTNNNAGIIKNSINAGILYYNGNNFSYTHVYPLGIQSVSLSNSYYWDETINKLKYYTGAVGFRKTFEQLSSHELFDTLNVNNAWIYKEGNIPTLKMPTTTARTVQELQINNRKKQLKIITEVQEVNGIKGGSISGNDLATYENVEYNENSTKQIKITPDDGYKIVGITINGERFSFKPEQDGTYTLPQFNSMQEDKHIIVSFEKEEKIFTINKVDADTREPLAGAKFKVEVKNDNIANRLNRGNQYYFPYNENTKQYISDNSVNTGIANTTANSLIPLPISVAGRYKVVVNASISSEEDKDIGWATIKRNSPSFDNTEGRFIYISGEKSSTNYESEVFENDGTENCYVVFGYTKDGSTDCGKDAFSINSVKLYNIDDENTEPIDIISSMYQYNQYDFKLYNGAYIPTNGRTYISNNNATERDNTYAFSYIPISFPQNGNYYIELNARISSEKNKDIGYATISKRAPSTAHGNGDDILEFMKISGEIENTTYRSEIINYNSTVGYYLNIVYNKDSANSVGEDALFINNIKLCSDTYKPLIDTTDENGQIKLSLTENTYTITELKAPKGYILNTDPIEFTYSISGEHDITIENTKAKKIEVNHYLWNVETGVTTEKVANSEEQNGNLGENYSTNPNFKIEYEIIRNKDFYKGKSQNEILSILEKNSIQEAGYESWDEFDNDYYIPQNASGQFSDTTQVIDYYYKSKTYTLTVKHLLEGTEKNVPSKTDGTVEDEVTEGLNKNEDYSTEKSNNVDYTKYVLVDKSDNFEGQIESDTVVRYYYRLKDTTGVIVHHYIVGTENKVPAKTEGVVDNEILPITGTAKVGDEYETSNASNKIAKNFKVATNKDVYRDNIPAELEGKENELYTPENATGTFKDEVQEVTYYYVLKISNQTNSISKTGPESISTEDEKVTYNITYNVAIQEYIGDATVQIVDTLPYKIDITKSSLKGGEYNDEDKTITWKDLIKDIDTYTNPETGNISILKKISVVYKDIDHSKTSMTNKVSGSTKLLTSNITTDVVEDTAITNYSLSNSNPEDNPNNPDNPNDPTNPTNPDPNVNPQNPDAPSEDNKLVVKSTKIEKDGTEKITSLDDKVAYSLKYSVDLEGEYKDDATVTIIDTLPYEIDTSKEYNLDGGTYDSKKKTITWKGTYNNEMAITKNISLVYKDIDVSKTKITNNVKGIFELENGYKEERTALFDTKTDFTTSIQVNKVWQGDSKSDSRPGKVTIELNSVDKNNKLTKIDEKKLTEKKEWKTTFKNLPKYDAKTGKEIIYNVTENNVPKGYYSSIIQENNTFTVTNSKYGSITITKIDSGDSSKKLSRAEFKLEKLKEENGKMEVDKSFATKTATSSSKGKLEFKNLEYGTYRLTETKAPEGYSLSKNSTQIEITPEKTDYVGELSNKEKTTLPLTGGTGRNILVVVGAFFLIILFMIKKKRIYVVRK